MNWNLPDGVTPSMIPGNSSREIAIERAMEEAEEMVMDSCASFSLMQSPLADSFKNGPEDAQAAIRNASETLEEVQAKLESAGAILDRVIYGDEPEHDD